jgi:2,4-dienoyl-CoA reductase-like NADH-dependent reductase (Old Yellow Enzyme family)
MTNDKRKAIGVKIRVPTPFDQLTLQHGPAWKNRFTLAPMTNHQSNPDGTITQDEHHWLTMRAKGGFALTMTCASHVQPQGQGFPGQLGCWSDDHIEGLTKLAAEIKAQGSVSSIQLHHAGFRSPKDLIKTQPVGPSDDEGTESRALSNEEVHQLRDDFIKAAQRAEKAGFDGVEIHGAHSYIICSFLSAGENKREDAYGGNPENRARLLMEILEGIRGACRPDFQVGIRLSPDRFGIDPQDILDLSAKLLQDERLDYLDISMWDYNRKNFFQLFADLPRKGVLLGVAGKLYSGKDVQNALDLGADFVAIGKAGILHHDFPLRIQSNPNFEMTTPPVTADYLRSEGLGEAFIQYMKRWEGFVK